MVISSPVAGLRPGRFFCAGLTRTVSCTSPPIRTFSGPAIMGAKSNVTVIVADAARR
jgi:hypothetical protein